MEFKLSEEAAKIGAGIMEEHHAHLLGVRVEFLMMSKTPKSKGKEVWGRAKKISGLPAFLAQETLQDYYEDQPADFFVIELSEEIWETLTAKGKQALIDHELSHCELEIDDETGATSLAIVGHDVTEFSAVMERHGLWNDGLRDFIEVGAEQLSLDGAALSAVR